VGVSGFVGVLDAGGDEVVDVVGGEFGIAAGVEAVCGHQSSVGVVVEVVGGDLGEVAVVADQAGGQPAGGLDQGEGLVGPVLGEEELGVEAVEAAGDVAAVLEGGAEQFFGGRAVFGGGVVFGGLGVVLRAALRVGFAALTQGVGVGELLGGGSGEVFDVAGAIRGARRAMGASLPAALVRQQDPGAQ
jgi:hypothetical protein